MLNDHIHSLAIITLSKEGLSLAKRMGEGLPVGHMNIYCPDEIADEDVNSFSGGLLNLIEEIFPKYRGLIFIMPLGIVIRAIAPNIRDKHTDPAVVVVDEVGRYVISTLSGHEGGANKLAIEISNILHTDAVITTAKEAKKDLIVGIGFRKGMGEKKIKDCILKTLSKIRASVENVRLIATVDRKAKERTLQKACQELGIPLKAVSYQEIRTCIKNFSGSKLVEEKMGLPGVSEPSALLAGRKTSLLIKEKYPGIVITVARENFLW